MNAKKKLLVILLCLFILASVMVGLFWHMQHYQMIDLQFYPKDAQELDLRGQEISVGHYNKLRRRMPDCTIYWDIPFQGQRYSQDTTTLTVQELTERDAELLVYFPQLQTLDARNCQAYDILQAVQKTYPRLQVRYTVTVGGAEYDQNAQTVSVDGITEEEIANLKYLPHLAQVQVVSGKSPAHLVSLTSYCKENGIALQIMIGGTAHDTDVTELRIEGITEEEISLLYFLTKLEKVTLVEPQASAETLLHFVSDHPSMDITWEKQLFGIPVTSDSTYVDLTAGISPEGAATYEKAKTASIEGDRDDIVYQFPVSKNYPIPDRTSDTAGILEELEQSLAYFPNVEELLICGAVLDNEAVAAFRDRHREDFKVVWTVQCGDKLYLRTDSPYLMPTKYHVYYFLDEDAVNLKYCEDMVCIDLGHMAIHNIDWVANMPNLTYLVLAHTQLQYVEPLRTCKNLKFLELDWSPIRDYSPLKDCTALEDLNLGQTFADFDPIGEMTWLKHLWMIGCSSGAAYRMSEALPDTTIMTSGSGTVANGWRTLPNYYAMRDAMNMYYMVW